MTYATARARPRGYPPVRFVPSSAIPSNRTIPLLSAPLRSLFFTSVQKQKTTTGGMIEPAAMGSEVGLALQLCAVRTVGGFVKDAATESASRAARLVESIKILEEEKRKIEAFQRELPLCMHLLGEVIDGLKKETERCGGGCFGRVLRELLPVESRVEEDGEVKVDDKMNWMSSAQLWSDNYGENDISHENHEEGRRQGKENLFLECKSPGGDGAFLPFEALSTVSASSEEKKPAAALPDRRGCGRGPKSVGRAPESSPAPATVCGRLGFQSQHQPSRKARRCWSQELHRRFTLAIQQLGGAQVATPKQIREVMKVEGLTNDEVKSHLQKYRLHAGKLPNASSAMASPPGAEGGSSCVRLQQQCISPPPQQSVSPSGSLSTEPSSAG
ncbi:transcription factor HHO2-like isoform X2 [Musa acuminata AAA Group]|uniref:transcription factor HHO2-like isoform X2 n=1 Tax=Musa acuminata AAA Group TaxID=214697 RepID=UPI0031D21224